MLAKTNAHREELEGKFQEYAGTAEETLEPILQNIDAKNIETVVLPPELFDKPYAIKCNEQDVITLACYPEGFNGGIDNLDVVAMMHEIMHTYIPVEEVSFNNQVQEDVYKVINHSLVELSANGELGMAIAGLDGYFQTPMHHEKLRDRGTGEVLTREDYLEQGIEYPEDFEFESRVNTQKGTIITGENELSNDKIRGIVYPYFLAFRYSNEENSPQCIIDAIKRDEKAIKELYGQEFYDSLFDLEKLGQVISSARQAENIISLNDVIAKDVFGMDVQREANKEEQVKEAEGEER